MKFIQTYDQDNGFVHQVEVDYSDVWNADYTMGNVIHAVMKKFKEDLTGSGYLSYDDFPEFKDKIEPSEWDENPQGGYSSEVTKWMIDEIIWATDPEWGDIYGIPCLQDGGTLTKRRARAMSLFGKYFFSFWN